MKVSHVGIAVRALEEAGLRYADLFDDHQPHREVVDDQGVEVMSFDVDGVIVELTGATRDDSPIARFLEKRGEGIHHIAFEVEDIEAELIRMQSLGIQLIDAVPRDGAHGMQIAFLHPKSFNGVLVELCQPAT